MKRESRGLGGKGGLLVIALLALLLAAAICVPASAQAETIYLKGNSDGTAGGNDRNDGRTPGTAVLTLQKAMELAGEGGTIMVAKGVSLTMDITIENVTIQREANYEGDLFAIGSVNNTPTVTLKNATIDGGNFKVVDESFDYASLFLINGGTLKIEEGAVLQNNWSTAVVVSNGSLEMSGGEICYNKADGNYGSAVHLQNDSGTQTFTMTGGSIHDNEQKQYCGTVSVGGKNAVFTMEGGMITNNETGYGGGVQIGMGEAYLKGGTISNNQSTSSGGGVYLWTSVLEQPACYLSGTEIIANSAPRGAGIYVAGGELYITGGSIEKNTSTSAGAGIYAYSGSSYGNNTINISGGTIQDNVVSNPKYGGAIAIYSADTSAQTALSLSGSPVIGGNIYNIWQ